MAAPWGRGTRPPSPYSPTTSVHRSSPFKLDHINTNYKLIIISKIRFKSSFLNDFLKILLWQNTVVVEADLGVNGYQAVALRIAGEHAMFYRSRFLGSQDTLLDENGSHYFLQCFIQGTTDFIFGRARSLYKVVSHLLS